MINFGESAISDLELHVIADEVGAANKVSEMVEALEMPEEAGGADKNPRQLLSRWQKEMGLMGIPARTYLMTQLLRIEMKDLHERFVHTY